MAGVRAQPSRQLSRHLNKFMQLGARRERGPCPQRATLEGGRGVGELQARLDLFAPQQAVDQPRVKSVARARRVPAAAWHTEGWRRYEGSLRVEDRAALAHRHPDHRTAVTRLE